MSSRIQNLKKSLNKKLEKFKEQEKNGELQQKLEAYIMEVENAKKFVNPNVENTQMKFLERLVADANELISEILKNQKSESGIVSENMERNQIDSLANENKETQDELMGTSAIQKINEKNQNSESGAVSENTQENQINLLVDNEITQGKQSSTSSIKQDVLDTSRAFIKKFVPSKENRADREQNLSRYKKALMEVEKTIRKSMKDESVTEDQKNLMSAANNIVGLVKAGMNSELFIRAYSTKDLADGLEALDRILKDPTKANLDDVEKVEKLSNSVPDKKPMRREVKGLLIALAVVVVLAAVAAAIVFTGGLGLLGVPLLGKAVGLMIGGLAKVGVTSAAMHGVVGVTSAAMHGAAHSVAALATGVPTTIGQATANVANAFTQAGNAAAQGYVNLVGGKFAAGVGVGAAAVTGIGLGAAALGKSKKVDVGAEQQKTKAAVSEIKSPTNKANVAAPGKEFTAKVNKTEVFKKELEKWTKPATTTDNTKINADVSKISNNMMK